MKPSPDSLYKWALAEGGNILHVVECVGAWAADRKRLEAAEKSLAILAEEVEPSFYAYAIAAGESET